MVDSAPVPRQGGHLGAGAGAGAGIARSARAHAHARARAAAILAGSFACLAVAATEAPATSYDDIVERGTLVAGVKSDYAPFGYRDPSGDIVGYDVDVAKMLADVLGVEIELVPVTSANRLQKLQRGEIDVIVATMGDTRSRRELVQMIEPHYYGDGANVLLESEERIRAWEDLRGKTLCSLQGSLWGRLAKERLLIETIAFNSTQDAALALRAGHCVGWIYDEANLLNEIRSGEWDGYEISLEPRFILPWAIAIHKDEAGERLDIAFGDALASWHRDGTLRDLESKWEIPPSTYLREAAQTWNRKDDSGQLECRRDDEGRWPLNCREAALVGSEDVGNLSGVFLWLLDATGLDLSVLYDPLDRRVYALGLALTASLSIMSVVASIGIGIALGWIMHRRISILAPALEAFCALLRMTPPLLQLFVVFFGLGGVVLALGFTLDAFTVSVCVFSLYAGAANAQAVKHAADVAARNIGKLKFRRAEIGRVLRLAFAGIVGNCTNIVKATGMASTLALPELVYASTSIISERGNDGVMMNLLLLLYFVLVFATVQAFRVLERKAVRSAAAAIPVPREPAMAGTGDAGRTGRTGEARPK